MYFLLFAAALPVVYMVWNKASNKWQLPPPSVFLTAEPKSRQHAVNETFVSAEVVIMMGSLSLLPSLYPQLSVCTHHHHRSAAIHSSGHFQNRGRRNIWKVGQSRAPSSRSPRGGRADVNYNNCLDLELGLELDWCWSEFWLVTGRLIRAGCCDHGHWSHTAPWSPGPRLSAVYTFTLSDQILHSIRRGKVGTFIGRIKGSAGLLLAPALARPGHDGCVKTRHFLHRVSPFCRVTS